MVYKLSSRAVLTWILRCF